MLSLALVLILLCEAILICIGGRLLRPRNPGDARLQIPHVLAVFLAEILEVLLLEEVLLCIVPVLVDLPTNAVKALLELLNKEVGFRL